MINFESVVLFTSDDERARDTDVFFSAASWREPVSHHSNISTDSDEKNGEGEPHSSYLYLVLYEYGIIIRTVVNCMQYSTVQYVKATTVSN